MEELLHSIGYRHISGGGYVGNNWYTDAGLLAGITQQILNGTILWGRNYRTGEIMFTPLGSLIVSIYYGMGGYGWLPPLPSESPEAEYYKGMGGYKG